MTYIETLTVAAVVLILAGAAVPMARWSARRAKEAELKRNLETIREAIDRFHRDAVTQFIDVNRLEDRGVTEGPPPARYYPPDLEILVEGAPLFGQGNLPGEEERKKIYLRSIPRDPFLDPDEECDQAGWHLVAYQDDADAPTWGGGNVWDVRSCSDLLSLDGETYYYEW